MEGAKNTETSTPTTTAKNNHGASRSDSKQFSSYHPNSNFRAHHQSSGGKNSFASNNSNRSQKHYNQNNNQNNGNQKKRDVLASQKLNNQNENGQLQNTDGFPNHDDRKKSGKSNSQNVNPSSSSSAAAGNAGGNKTKRVKSNRRRHAGQNNNANNHNNQQGEKKKEDRLNQSLTNFKTLENSSSLSEMIDDCSSNARQIPVSISLDNFQQQQQYNERKKSPKRSPRRSNSFRPPSVNDLQHTSNTIVDNELAEIEISCASFPSHHYQVASTDPLAEMFKHAASTVSPFEHQHEMTSNAVNVTTMTSHSEASFYSTPLTHILPAKYDGLENMIHCHHHLHNHHNYNQSSTSMSSDATVYFSAEPTLSGTLPSHMTTSIGADILISTTSSSSSSSSSSNSPDRHLAESIAAVQQKSLSLFQNDGEPKFLSPAVEETTEKTFTMNMANEDTMSIDNEIEETIKIAESKMTTITTTLTSNVVDKSLSMSSNEEENIPSSSVSSRTASSTSSVESSSNEIIAMLKQEAPKATNEDDYDDQDEKDTITNQISTATETGVDSNCSMQLNYPSSTASELTSEKISSSQSSSFNKGSSGIDEDDEDDNQDYLKADAQQQQLKKSEIDPVKKNDEFRTEVAHLIETVVSDAIAQAMKRSGNDSLIEIDINETLTTEATEKRLAMSQSLAHHHYRISHQQNEQEMTEPKECELRIEENFNLKSNYEEEKARKLDEVIENKRRSIANSIEKAIDVMSPTPTPSTIKLERKDTTMSNEHINDSTASINSSASMNLTNQRKNPIVDCFSCSIL